MRVLCVLVRMLVFFCLFYVRVSVCQCHLLNSRAEYIAFFSPLRFCFVLVLIFKILFVLVIPKVSSFSLSLSSISIDSQIFAAY